MCFCQRANKNTLYLVQAVWAKVEPKVTPHSACGKGIHLDYCDKKQTQLLDVWNHKSRVKMSSKQCSLKTKKSNHVKHSRDQIRPLPLLSTSSSSTIRRSLSGLSCTSLDASRQLRGTVPHSSSSGISLSSNNRKMQLVSTMAFSNCSSSSGGPAAVGQSRTRMTRSWISACRQKLKRQKSKHYVLTLVRCLSSQDCPELLRIRTLWVDPFLDDLHLVGPAAQVLLRLDESGEIHCL